MLIKPEPTSKEFLADVVVAVHESHALPSERAREGRARVISCPEADVVDGRRLSLVEKAVEL